MKCLRVDVLSLAVALLVQIVAGIDTGGAPGIAAGTTGGNATPVYPKDINELKSYLSDSQPRV
ncbi:hypothetical protein Gpo141_00012538, partial [Globisporangium polare]